MSFFIRLHPLLFSLFVPKCNLHSPKPMFILAMPERAKGVLPRRLREDGPAEEDEDEGKHADGAQGLPGVDEVGSERHAHVADGPSDEGVADDQAAVAGWRELDGDVGGALEHWHYARESEDLRERNYSLS